MTWSDPVIFALGMAFAYVLDTYRFRRSMSRHDRRMRKALTQIGVVPPARVRR